MATLEKLLDSVSDAVSVMVIFSNDAGSNNAVLRNLKSGAEGVRTAVSYLISEARETVALWNDLGSLECSTRMNDCCDGLMNSVNDIVNACGDIQKDPHDNAAKAALLDAGKDVMKQMVAVLQYNDLYDVMSALNKVVVVQTLLTQVKDDTWIAEDFAELIRIIGVSLEKRFENTHDIRTKQMLEESKVELEKLGIGLATIVTRSRQDPKFKDKIPVIITPLTQAILKTIKAIKMSAKSPFDLNMLETEFQYHDEEFIDEITVTASDFHASLNAIKKAVKSGDEFEIERAIRAIESDLKAEIATAEELAEETSDPVLRAQMMARIKAAKVEMGNLLYKVSCGAKQGMMSGDLSVIDPLLESVSKMFSSLLEGTATNELMMAGDSVTALFGDLLIAIGQNDGLEAVALTKDIAREIERQGLYASAIAETFDDGYRKQRVLGDYQQLAALCADIPELTNQALKGVSGALNRLEGLISEARTLENDLLTAATTTTEADLMEGAQLITQALQNLKPLMNFPQQNRDMIATNLSQLLKKMKHQTAMATSWAEAITDDPTLKARIVGHAQQLNQAAAPLALSIKKCLSAGGSGPNFEASKAEFLECAEKFGSLNQCLVSAVVQSPSDELEGLQGKLACDVTRLKQAMASRDLEAIATAIAEIKKNSKGMNFLANLVSGDLDDPDLQRRLLEASSRLVGKLDNLIDASKNALRYPKDQNYQCSFNDLLSDFETNVLQLITASDSATPEDQMVSNATSITKLGKKFAREVENDHPHALATLEGVKKKVVKQKELAHVVAKRCDFSEELAGEVVKATIDLSNMLLFMEKKAMDIKDKPGDKNLTSLLQKATNDFCDQSTLTGTVAQTVKTAKKEAEERTKEEARIAEEMAKQEAANKQKVAEQAVPIGIKEVWMDAQVLVTMISESKLLEDNTPVGSLVGLADKLARSMQELASLSKSGTKNQIITLARNVAGMVDEISKFVAEVAQNCRDPLLNREMVDMGHVAKNFAVQLKIICGVKAGLLLEDDKDTAQCLIVCAKGLCRAVGDVVSRAQIAKLKPKTGNAPAPRTAKS